jgi:hypothetical protein
MADMVGLNMPIARHLLIVSNRHAALDEEALLSCQLTGYMSGMSGEVTNLPGAHDLPVLSHSLPIYYRTSQAPHCTQLDVLDLRRCRG